MVDLLFCEHLAHIRLAGGVADKTGSAAEQCNRLVPGELHALHKAERHEVTDVQAVRCRVEADVERSLSVVDEIGYLFLVCELREKPAAL